MKAQHALTLAEGDLDPAVLSREERALYSVARKSVIEPAKLDPDDLKRWVDVFGRVGAIELVAVLASFHFINRIADLVGIQSDLPIVQPRFAALRRLGVRFQGWAMGRFLDLENRSLEFDGDAALSQAESVFGPLPKGYAEIRDVPNVAAFLTTVSPVVGEIDPKLRRRVDCAVASALPTCEAEAVGFHARPIDPLDALAFVGTRYAARTTPKLVDAVRAEYGYDDAQLTDVFYAIAMRNAFERMNRLLAEPLS